MCSDSRVVRSKYCVVALLDSAGVLTTTTVDTKLDRKLIQSNPYFHEFITGWRSYSIVKPRSNLNDNS